jgi:hypothetical protein
MSFFLGGKLSQKFDLKNVISTYKKGFLIGEKAPYWPDFQILFFQFARFIYDKFK